MDIYIPLYNQILLLEKRENIKNLIEECINKGTLIKELNKFIKYNLGENTESYVNKVFDEYIFNYKSGLEITKILYEFISENNLNSINNISYRWFIDMLNIDNSNNLNIKNNIIVSRSAYNELINIKNNFNSKKEEIKRLNKSKLIRSEKYKMELTNKNKALINENKELKKKYDLIKKQCILSLGEQYLINKRLLIVIENINQKDITNAIEKYKLSKIYIHSSINPSSILEDYINSSQIIIFSTSQAKHSIDSKIKYSEKLFRTTKVNLNTIFEEYINYMGLKILKSKEVDENN